MTTESADTAGLLSRARQSLETYLAVGVDDDGTLTFTHAGVPCVVQATRLAEGLGVLSLTCVIGWDLDDDPSRSAAIAERAGQGLFGTLGVVRTQRGVDVTLRYAFPADGIDPGPLGTLLMLVVSTASELRGELLDGSSSR